jgi:hypothetical protein
MGDERKENPPLTALTAPFEKGGMNPLLTALTARFEKAGHKPFASSRFM